MSSTESDPQRSAAARRMRLSRERRRDGMRVIPFEVRDAEIEQLVAIGLLAQADRDNRSAIARALGNFMDRIPPAWWRVAAAR